MSDTITMGRTKRERCSGHWKTQSTNCYKGHEPNDYKDVVICEAESIMSHRLRVVRSHQFYLVLGPDVTGENDCL